MSAPGMLDIDAPIPDHGARRQAVSVWSDRCEFTTIDPDSAVKYPRRESLRTLSGYRRGADGGVYLGPYLIPEQLSHVRIGYRMETLD